MSQLPVDLGKAPLTIKRSWPSWSVQLTAILGLALYLNALMWWTESPDMRDYLLGWFEHIVTYGPIGAFAHPFSDYEPTYLYLLAGISILHRDLDPMSLVKLVSVGGSVFAAIAVSDLVGATGGRRRYAVLVLIMPSVVINAAMLGQCDAFWAGACVFAVSSMVRGQTARSMAWCGVAIAFKLQSVFIAPFIVGCMLGYRAQLWKWAIPAVVFSALLVPAWLAGWPAWKLAMAYPLQTAAQNFSGNLANPWILASLYPPQIAKQYHWIGISAAVATAISIVALSAAVVRNPRAMVLLALLSSLALPFLLPKMHERYFFLADLLSLAAAISYREPKVFWMAGATQLASLLSLLTYVYFTSAYPTLVGVLFATAALVLCLLLTKRSIDVRCPLVRSEAWSTLASMERATR